MESDVPLGLARTRPSTTARLVDGMTGLGGSTATMPVTFHAFGREGGQRSYAAPDGTPYCELSGSAAFLLIVCPTLATSFGTNLLIPYCMHNR